MNAFNLISPLKCVLLVTGTIKLLKKERWIYNPQELLALSCILIQPHTVSFYPTADPKTKASDKDGNSTQSRGLLHQITPPIQHLCHSIQHPSASAIRINNYCITPVSEKNCNRGCVTWLYKSVPALSGRWLSSDWRKLPAITVVKADGSFVSVRFSSGSQVLWN